ncbi:MAG TPA: hypothetical protein VFE96_07675 [Candidatus Bathyarchaeia archaeon]|jgi:hypothetical protein|nr:hypothetical protein [Candidatus Bathyarchaeia archaeon]
MWYKLSLAWGERKVGGDCLKFPLSIWGETILAVSATLRGLEIPFSRSWAGDENILFVDSDEEAPKMLLDYVGRLRPQFPYYWVRRVGLVNNKYVPISNPNFNGKLCSNRVRFIGRVNEIIVPREPHGVINIPIIHRHAGPAPYSSGGQSRLRLELLKVQEVILGW